MTPGGAVRHKATLNKARGAIGGGRLLVIGGGVLSRQNGQPRMKRALGDYLAPLTEDFSQVRWMGGESREPLAYQHLPGGVAAMEAWSSMSGELLALAWQRAQGEGPLAAVLHLPNLAASIAAPWLWMMRSLSLVALAFAGEKRTGWLSWGFRESSRMTETYRF